MENENESVEPECEDANDEEVATEKEAEDMGDMFDDEDAKYQREDVVQKHKFDYLGTTAMLENFPELHCKADIEDNPANKTTVVAPGQGKVPTNILTEKDWDTRAFPCLHPDGQNGLDSDRGVKLSKQKYFEQRILNEDLRFSSCPEYVFSAFACCERERLDKNVDIAFRRGKKKANGQYSLDDPWTVLDNTPGTPRYWQKRKYEMIARLDNLGAFQQFFTLTCADMRWNENFTVFLKEYQLSYEVVNGLEECLVTDKNGDVYTLDEFIKRDENKSKYEFIRKNVLTATLHFNNRVEEFFNKIIMSKKSKMPVKYYNYRVEFQLRGAGHIHGCLWLDLDKLSLIKCKNDPEEREAMDECEIDEPCKDDPDKFTRIFD